MLSEVEAGLKKSKKEGRYTIGNFGTFTVTRRKAQGARPQTGEQIRIKVLLGALYCPPTNRSKANS